MTLAVCLASVALAGGASARSKGVSVSVASAIVRPGDRVVVQISGAAPKRSFQIYLRVSPLIGRSLLRVGRAVSNARGQARLGFRLPPVAANVYRPWIRVGKRLVAGHGLLSVAALPPPGFGTLGGPGCAPASPRNQDGTGFAETEVFGTSAGAQLWALSAAQPISDQATLSGVVGKQTKIIFRMTSGVPQIFFAVAPDGTRVPPVWGPDPHLGSNWDRPGAEWGAGFVFSQTGCWRIHAGAPPSAGDLWLSITS